MGYGIDSEFRIIRIVIRSGEHLPRQDFWLNAVSVTQDEGEACIANFAYASNSGHKT